LNLEFLSDRAFNKIRAIVNFLALGCSGLFFHQLVSFLISCNFITKETVNYEWKWLREKSPSSPPSTSCKELKRDRKKCIFSSSMHQLTLSIKKTSTARYNNIWTTCILFITKIQKHFKITLTEWQNYELSLVQRCVFQKWRDLIWLHQR